METQKSAGKEYRKIFLDFAMICRNGIGLKSRNQVLDRETKTNDCSSTKSKGTTVSVSV